MIINKKWISLIELVVSITILSIFLLSTYTYINSSYSVIWYIDSNINWLNMSKSLIDETINIRNTYLETYPYNWWEKFVQDYWSWTFKASKEKCEITDEYKYLYLCPIDDETDQYEWPLNNLGDLISNINGKYFYRKLDVNTENDFYLKNINRQKTSSWETLILEFTDTIYNNNSFFIYWDFEDNNIIITGSWLNINYFDINWIAGNWILNNLNNNNLRYSKIIEYNTWSTIFNNDNLTLSFSGETYTFNFLDDIPTTTISGLIPIKIDNDIHKSYYQLCKEINALDIVNCDLNYFIKENFYDKILWTEKELSNIDFWDDYNFSFSWSKNNEIWINIINSDIPITNTLTFLNPSWKIVNNPNDLVKNNILNLISDSTSWKWIEIPNLSSIIWEVNTNTWFTSLLNIKTTTLLYDWKSFIDSFVIESKLWDINRYQNNNE